MLYNACTECYIGEWIGCDINAYIRCYINAYMYIVDAILVHTFKLYSCHVNVCIGRYIYLYISCYGKLESKARTIILKNKNGKSKKSKKTMTPKACSTKINNKQKQTIEK